MLLRAPFAVRSLQAGGEPEAVCSILGLTSMASLKRYEQLSTQKSKQESAAEEYPVRAMAVSQRSERRRRPTSEGRRNHQRRGADKTHRTGKKKPASGAEEDL